MSKPVLMGAPLRPRICVRSSETLAVQVTVGPNCKEKLRLMWPGSVLQIPAHRVVYLECPLCRHPFSLLAIDLVSHTEGGEQEFKVDALAGFRYWHFGENVDLRPPTSI